MLRIILLLVVLAICSTCLVRPWFWKKVRENKHFFKCFKDSQDWGGSHIAELTWAEKVTAQIIISIIVMLFSIWIFCSFCCRQNFYGVWVAIIICLIVQLSFFPFKKKIGNIAVILAILLICVCGIQDTIVKDDITIPLNKVDSIKLATYNNQSDSIKLFISSNEIQSLFKVDSAIGPTYNNGKYIFVVSGGDTGNGIVIIDRDGYNEAKFLPCSYKLDTSNIYFQYPTQKLKKLYIAISDEDVPYGIFAVCNKNWLLGTYHVDVYVMLNLLTGETQEFTQEQLPSFVTNN